ncbi:MAG: hypothetical protein ACLVJ8_04585 [Ruthenibacterium lactatiformans]
MRTFFEKYGKPTWYVDRLIYTFRCIWRPSLTPFLCYGENVSFEYGGNADVGLFRQDRSRTALPSGSPRRSCWATA